MRRHFFYRGLSYAAISLAVFAVILMIPADSFSKDSATRRPIEDFIVSQGTYCIPDGTGGCFLFVPPVENFAGWGDPNEGLLASVDYAGLADRWLYDNDSPHLLGTQMSGKITERLLPDGRVQVQVILRTSNALTWVVDDPDNTNDFNGPLLFGSRADDVLEGAEPGLADCHMNLVFINSSPGEPLPDLMQILVERFEDLRFLSFKASATGPLRELFGEPDGTPGRVKVTEVGLFMTQSMRAAEDGYFFPVENIKIQPVADE